MALHRNYIRHSIFDSSPVFKRPSLAIHFTATSIEFVWFTDPSRTAFHSPFNIKPVEKHDTKAQD
jgi:hypothetical protein